MDLLAYHRIATESDGDLRAHLLLPLTIDGHYEAIAREHGKKRKRAAPASGGGLAAIARHMAAAGNSPAAVSAALGGKS